MEPGAALTPPVAAAFIPCRWHRSKEKLHRNQALAQLSKEYFLRKGPQRSLSRFLTNLWGRDLTAGSMDGSIQQNSPVLYGLVDSTLWETEHMSRAKLERDPLFGRGRNISQIWKEETCCT